MKNLELKEVIRLAKMGDMEAKDFIVRKYDYLVKKVVRDITGGQDEDLIAIGYRGVLMTIDQFNLDKDTAFGTIARYKIKGVISNEFTNRKRDKRKINYMNNASLNEPLTEVNSEGNEDILYEIIPTDNGKEHGYAHIFEDDTISLLDAVKQLNPLQQAIFELKFIQGMGKNEEIAEILGLGTKSKVDYQIRRLRRDLNDIMGLDYEIPGIKSVRKQSRPRKNLN